MHGEGHGWDCRKQRNQTENTRPRRNVRTVISLRPTASTDVGPSHTSPRCGNAWPRRRRCPRTCRAVGLAGGGRFREIVCDAQGRHAHRDDGDEDPQLAEGESPRLGTDTWPSLHPLWIGPRLPTRSKPARTTKDRFGRQVADPRGGNRPMAPRDCRIASGRPAQSAFGISPRCPCERTPRPG